MMGGFLLVFTLWVGPGGRPSGDRWFGADKVKHFLASAAIQGTAYAMLRGVQATRQQGLAGASAAALAAGITKEWWDAHRGGRFSLKDLTWDVAGASSVAVAFRHGP